MKIAQVKQGSRAIATAVLVLALSASAPVWAREVAGVHFDEQAQIGNTALQLNGAGVRTKIVFKVYAAGLYLKEKTNDPVAVINSDTPRRVVLRMLRDVDGQTLLDALKDGLRANLSEGEYEALSPGVADLTRIFQAVGSAKSGDAIVLDLSRDGIAVTRNGSAVGQVSDGAMAKALLKVWLGEKPAEASLKKALLGQ